MPYYKIRDDRGQWEGRHSWGGYGEFVEDVHKARIWKTLGAVKLHLNHAGSPSGLTIVEFDMLPTGKTIDAGELMADLRTRRAERQKREAIAEAERKVEQDKKKLAELKARYENGQ